MLRYNREKSSEEPEGKTPNLVPINYLDLNRRDVSCCKCHTPSRPASDEDVMLSPTAAAAAAETQGSQDRPLTWFTSPHPLKREYSVLSSLMVHITPSPTPSLPHSKQGHRAVMDSMQNAATWYTAEREGRAKC